MSGSLNSVQLIGNLGADVELRKTQSGDSVANISIATSESWTDKNNGQKRDKVEWHRVVIFGKVADIAGQYLKKGSKVYIQGQLETRKWTDQSGQDKYTTEIVVKGFGGSMLMLDGRNDNQQSNQSSHDQSKANGYQPQGGYDDMDDEIPF